MGPRKSLVERKARKAALYAFIVYRERERGKVGNSVTSHSTHKISYFSKTGKIKQRGIKENANILENLQTSDKIVWPSDEG